VSLFARPEPGRDAESEDTDYTGELDDQAGRPTVGERYPCDKSHSPPTV
jgi:hypothetical protein